MLRTNTGIGRDIAVTLYKRGAQTVALSRTQADLDSLEQEVGAQRLPLYFLLQRITEKARLGIMKKTIVKNH